MVTVLVVLLSLALLTAFPKAYGGFAEPRISPPLLPIDPDDMVKQASLCVQKAWTEGKINRQTIRLPLSESMYMGKEESFVADRAIG